jgi:hypothetical protein
MGWLFSPRCVPVRHELVRDLARRPELQLLQRYYYICNLGYALMLYAVGETWCYFNPVSAVSGVQLVIWGANVSTVCVYHSIWSARSFCHRFGTRRFATPIKPKQPVVSLVTFGDGQHQSSLCPARLSMDSGGGRSISTLRSSGSWRGSGSCGPKVAAGRNSPRPRQQAVQVFFHTAVYEWAGFWGRRGCNPLFRFFAVSSMPERENVTALRTSPSTLLQLVLTDHSVLRCPLGFDDEMPAVPKTENPGHKVARLRE